VDAAISVSKAHTPCDCTMQTDLKGLSGGERSYSTLAFTMALESVISVPFCCLDEFDVVRNIRCSAVPPISTMLCQRGDALNMWHDRHCGTHDATA
jgi:hypothetical protein